MRKIVLALVFGAFGVGCGAPAEEAPEEQQEALLASGYCKVVYNSSTKLWVQDGNCASTGMRGCSPHFFPSANCTAGLTSSTYSLNNSCGVPVDSVACQ
jgi:hypothetical protein